MRIDLYGAWTIQDVLEEDVILAGEHKEWSLNLKLQKQEMILSEVWVEGIFQRNWYKEGLKDNYFSLLPGERRVIKYTEGEDISFNEYTFK